MALPNNPITRKEMYLSNMAGQGTALPSEPITREEEYLDFIAKNGGGGGGTGDGDMKKSVYDSDLDVSGAGGIKAFVNAATSALQPKTLDTPITIGGEAMTTVEAALGALEDNKEDTILAATPLVKEYDEVMRQNVLRLTMDDTPTASSNNPVKSGGVKSAVTATVDLLKDTTGWTGKNRLTFPYATWDPTPITVTINVGTDGTLTINGTQNADMGLPFHFRYPILSADKPLYLPIGKYTFTVGKQMPVYVATTYNGAYKDLSEISQNGTVEFEITENTQSDHKLSDGSVLVAPYVKLNAGTYSNEKLYPMVCLSDVYALSPSFEPYHESVEDYIWDINAKTGAHNFVLRSLSGYSLGAQGNIYADATYDLHFGIVTQGESYTVTTDDSAGFVGGYFTSMPTTSSVTYDSSRVVSANKTFTAPIDGYVVFRTTHNYATPMFCLADDHYDGYTKGAMTNRQLTEKVTVKSDSITSSFTANGDVANGLKKIGEIVFIDAAYKEVTASQWDVIATIPAGFRPKTPCRLLDGFGKKSLVINANGDIQAAESISNTYVYIHGSWVVS